MSKIKINGKEVEFDMSSMEQLSDEELETISGGIQSIESMLFYSWICNTCHEQGANFLECESAFKEAMKAHKTATGHFEFIAVSMRYKDGLGFGVNGMWKETV